MNENRGEYACQVSGLTVAYHDHLALDKATFELPRGEVMAVLGPNGAGKSTLLKAMLGLVDPLGGQVRFFAKEFSQVRQRVGYMPQSASVDWDFPASVFDVVLMGTYGRLGWLSRIGKAERAAAHAALEMVGLSDLASRHISQLSGGQKQRVFLARVLAGDPDIFLMDEPFAGVDQASEASIRQTLRALAERGKTIMVVHHDLRTVAQFCTWSILLAEGKVISYGPLERAFTPEILCAGYGISLDMAGV